MKIKNAFLLSLAIILAISFASSVTSCVSQKKILMLQNEQMENDTSNVSIVYNNQRSFDYKVQPGDNLHIRVITMESKSAAMFNGANNYISNVSGQYSGGNPYVYLNGYTIDDDGYITVPIIGKFYVKDMSIDEIEVALREAMGEYLKEVTIYVKLGLFNLTVLGEVLRPGQYQIYQSDINVFQAIAMAGNMTDYANKKNVKIIHQTPEGSVIERVNLNDADVLSSKNYYLKPNDIIYVEPMKIKQYGFTAVPYGTIFSAVSLLITCLTFIFVYDK